MTARHMVEGAETGDDPVAVGQKLADRLLADLRERIMKVWVTRDENSGRAAVDGAAECGARSRAGAGACSRRVLTDARDEIARLGPDDWLVLTSVFAVRGGCGRRRPALLACRRRR